MWYHLLLLYLSSPSILLLDVTLYLFQNGGTIICSGHIAFSTLNFFSHSFWSKAGFNSISSSFGCDVAESDLSLLVMSLTGTLHTQLEALVGALPHGPNDVFTWAC